MKWKRIHKIIAQAKQRAGDTLPGLTSLYNNVATPTMGNSQLAEEFVRATAPLNGLPPDEQEAIMRSFIVWWAKQTELREPRVTRFSLNEETDLASTTEEVENLLREEIELFDAGGKLTALWLKAGLNTEAVETLLTMFALGVNKKVDAWDFLKFDSRQRKRAQKSIDRKRPSLHGLMPTMEALL